MAIRVFVAVILVFCALGVGIACFLVGGADDNVAQTPPPAPTTPEPTGSGPAEVALAKYIQSNMQKEFVEDCAKADAAKDAGKICSVFRGERQGQKAYAIGPTFSEGTGWAFVNEQNGQWNVVATVPRTPDNAAVPGIPWPLRTGADVVVVGAAPCVNVREGPSINTRAVDCIRDGTTIRLASGPSQADGFQWWQVAGRAGWIVDAFLRYPDAAQ